MGVDDDPFWINITTTHKGSFPVNGAEETPYCILPQVISSFPPISGIASSKDTLLLHTCPPFFRDTAGTSHTVLSDPDHLLTYTLTQSQCVCTDKYCDVCETHLQYPWGITTGNHKFLWLGQGCLGCVPANYTHIMDSIFHGTYIEKMGGKFCHLYYWSTSSDQNKTIE